MATKSKYTVPGLDKDTAGKVVQILQSRLAAYNDLQLTLKHVHWNVVGPNFISSQIASSCPSDTGLSR